MRLALQLRSGETIAVSLREVNGPDNSKLWESSEGPKLEILVDHEGNIASVGLSEDIASSKEQIYTAFYDSIAEISKLQASGVEYSDDGDINFSEDEPFPYDPETIRVETKPFNISLVDDMINDKDIDLSPDFQRHFVWTDLGTRSRLIESIMLRIPLPVFYLSQGADGRFQVVDGLQRLTVINQFLSGKLRLHNLEYLHSEEGKYFKHDDAAKSIDQKFRKRILQTQIMVNIIDPQTPPTVKFDIFKRLNQGGRPLNAQEIRNCMASDAVRAFIGELCASEEFRAATCGSVGTVRMQDQELVLRFLAFKLSERGTSFAYHGNMERYLDEAIVYLVKNGADLPVLKSSFYTAMKNCEHLFGQYAFRKCTSDDLIEGARRRLINNSLFTTWSVTLSSYDSGSVGRVARGSMAAVLADTIEEDERFYDSITSGTNDRRRLDCAFQVARTLCKEVIK